MIRAGCGQSLRPNTKEAAGEALDEARNALGESTATAAFVFATSHHSQDFPEMFQFIRRQAQTRAAVGATGSGVIGPRGEIENTAGLVVLLLSGDTLSASAAFLSHPDSQDAAEHLKAELPRIHREPGLLTLAVHPQHISPMFVHRLTERFPETPIIGAAAAWCTPDQQAVIAADGDAGGRGCAALHLAGGIEPVIGVAQAVIPEAKPRTITEAYENVIMTIDSEPAADVLSDFLQSVHDQSQSFQPQNIFCTLGLSAENFDTGRYIVRNILSIEPASKHISVSEAVRPGLFVSFGLRKSTGARRSFRHMLERMSRSLTAKAPRAAVMFNCCARGRSLHNRPHVDLDSFHEFFPDLPIAGFFGFAEIGPILWDGKQLKSALLNHTAVLTLLTEPMEMLKTA